MNVVILLYFCKPGIEDPEIVHVIGFELNWETLSSNWMHEVWNSDGEKVTVISTIPLPGTIPERLKKLMLYLFVNNT